MSIESFGTMDGTTVTALTAVGGVLSGAITAVYKRLTAKLDECEEKHESATTELRDMSERVGKLEGYMEGLKVNQPTAVSPPADSSF